MADLDLGVIAIVVSIAVGIAGFISGQLYAIKNRRDQVEKAKREKITDDRALAREVAAESEALTLEAKQEMREYITNIIVGLKADIELAKAKANNLDSIRDMKLEQLTKEFYEYKLFQNGVNEKVTKAIEFVQTMLWGPEAKSMPPFMLGEDESQEHRDEPEVGMFKGKQP